MNKRFLFPLMISVLFSLLLFSCGKESIPLYYDIDTAPVNLDPQSASDYSSQLIINSLFEGLLRSGENGEVEPAAAESYTTASPTGLSCGRTANGRTARASRRTILSLHSSGFSTRPPIPKTPGIFSALKTARRSTAGSFPRPSSG